MARAQQNKFRREKFKQERQAGKARLAASATGISILTASPPVGVPAPSLSPAAATVASTSTIRQKPPPAWAGSSLAAGPAIAPVTQPPAVAVDADGFYDLGDEGVEEGDAEWAASYEADALEDEEGGGADGHAVLDEDGDIDDDEDPDGPEDPSNTIHVQPSAQRSSGYDLGPYTGAVLNEDDIANGATSAQAAATIVDTAELEPTGASEVGGSADREALLGPGKKRKRGQERKPERAERKKGAGAGSGPAVLPVASLPQDWDGEVLDGATYLATVQRANQSLPDYTRVENPYEAYYESMASSSTIHHPDPVHSASHHRPKGKGKNKAKSSSARAAESSAASSRPARHPALPKEAWAILFPLHFQAYKERLAASWPPSPPLPYPSTWPAVPNSTSRLEWSYYINGAPRRWIRQRKAPATEDGGGEADMELDEDEEHEVAAGGEAELEMDEEAMMNASAEQQAAVAQKERDRAKAEEESWEEVLEPYEERHRPREPVLSALQRLDTSRIIAILSNMSDQIASALETCEAELDLSSLTQSGTAPDATNGSVSTSKNQTPLNERYTRWMFALLGILESPLSASQTSALRELARVAMRVGAWRWVKAVMASEVGLPISADEEGNGSGAIGANRPPPWVLGARWKYHRDIVPPPERKISAALPPREQLAPRDRESYEEASVDETLARCWMIVYAIAAGWAQWDLVADLENMFS